MDTDYCRCKTHGHVDITMCDLNVCEMMMRVWIYVLELVGGRYYVGKTQFYEDRMKQHFEGRGSEWTMMHKPVRIVYAKEMVESTETNWYAWSNNYEKEKTLEIMCKYGWENVRGAGWCRRKISEPRVFVKERKKKERLEKIFRKMIEESIVKDEKIAEKIEKRIRLDIEKKLKEAAHLEDVEIECEERVKMKKSSGERKTRKIFDIHTRVFSEVSK